MMLKRRTVVLNPTEFNPGSNNVLGTTPSIKLDHSDPIEEIIILVSCTAGGTGPTLVGPDSPLNILKKIVLNYTDGLTDTGARDGVSISGVGLLEYGLQVGANIDTATRAAIALSQGSSITANQKFRIAYRLPMVHPMITEPLRSRMLLPVHTFGNDVTLRLEFAQAAELYSAGSISAITVEIVIIRREMEDSFTQTILSKGGFIRQDLVETNFAVPVSTSQETRFALGAPGSYTGILIRQYQGGSSVTRDVIDAVTTFGQESKWILQKGMKETLLEWRWKHLQIVNEWSQPLNAISQTSSPTLAGAVASGTSFRAAASTFLDFLTDGYDSANELGSVLDCNDLISTGKKMEIVGTPSSVSTNAHQVYIVGHRLYGDLSQWQAVK